MYFVYALKSKNHNWIYVGLTENLERRVTQHNKGYNKSTKPYAPFLLFYSEELPDRLSARKREKYFKTSGGKARLRKILNAQSK